MKKTSFSFPIFVLGKDFFRSNWWQEFHKKNYCEKNSSDKLKNPRTTFFISKVAGLDL